jgi:hypothetical protein
LCLSAAGAQVWWLRYTCLLCPETRRRRPDHPATPANSSRVRGNDQQFDFCVLLCEIAALPRKVTARRVSGSQNSAQDHPGENFVPAGQRRSFGITERGAVIDAGHSLLLMGEQRLDDDRLHAGIVQLRREGAA